MICPHSYIQTAFVRGLTLVYSAPCPHSCQDNRTITSILDCHSLSRKEWLLFSIQPFLTYLVGIIIYQLNIYFKGSVHSSMFSTTQFRVQRQERFSFESFCDGTGYRPPEKSLLTTNSHLDSLFPWPQCDTQKPEGEILVIHNTHCMGPKLSPLKKTKLSPQACGQHTGSKSTCKWAAKTPMESASYS